MSDSRDFLVELGCEELPPKSLKALRDSFADGIRKGLAELGLSHAGVQSFAAPRRLAVIVEGLAARQADRSQQLDGPPVKAAFDADGQPTQAALGFARKNGVEVAALDRSGDKLRLVKHIPGAATTSLLPGVVQAALDNLPIAKRMRWGATRVEFVRPTQWLLMLFGDEVVPCELLGQTADRCTRGHRFHCDTALPVANPARYADLLKDEGHVLADFDLRREMIRHQVNAMAAVQGGTALMPEALLEEVTALVEWPVPLVCAFEERFLAVPQEALITTMQDNQKYFCLVDADGRLLPRFITVANIDSPQPELIVRGNEKVVRPRLTDAEFFFQQDQKQPLETFNERLETVVFQAELGTVYDKAQRVAALARFIAGQIGANPDWAERAGKLSKCDLATAMVGEFPEMQGIAGYYYARHGGEPGEVPRALDEQYMPRGAGAELPATLTGAALALADKLDTLVGIFGIGMLPTGSKDPYALRRQALGVLRILIEKQLELDLPQALDAAVAQYGERVQAAGLAGQVLDFIYDRLRARYEDEGVPVAVYQAVRALQPRSALDFDQRVHAVQAFSRLPEAEALAAANKRVANILGKRDAGEPIAEIDTALLQESAEQALAAQLASLQAQVAPLFAARRYSEGLSELASLRAAVDRFFDSVMVMAEDEALRRNRIALLAALQALFLRVADIAQLVPGR
ncbi:MAG: glycine--tRNA ligase subunit beta [Spongiibacteraceae bacterium]|jgi:glycyl-tRNA synthetase beta chain|nr:glycine--tRNA ligase subunit beta [Spongiibacteraceae bacterium]